MDVQSKVSFLKSTLEKWYPHAVFLMLMLLIYLQILVHAQEHATDALIEACSNIRSMTKNIFAPRNCETVQIGQQTNSFSINITDELLASLKISRVCYQFFSCEKP